jgi:putative nucleotidyltransferase with HDIG domain
VIRGFRARTFLLLFLPCTLVLAGSFAMTRLMVQAAVRNTVRESLRDNFATLFRARERSSLQNNRFLAVIGENPALKAGMQLFAVKPGDTGARLTLEDQLRELCSEMGFDLLAVSGPNGEPEAAITRRNDQLVPVNAADLHLGSRGLLIWNATTWQVASVPVLLGDQILGSVSIGERFDLRDFTSPAVLLHDGAVLAANLGPIPPDEISAALTRCSGECDVTIAGSEWLSLPIAARWLGPGYTLRTLENLDTRLRPINVILGTAFLSAFVAAMLFALLSSAASSRMIAKPIDALAAHLRRTEASGSLEPVSGEVSGIREIQHLVAGLNRAAHGIHASNERLRRAYIDFTGSLASALDARDPYTAGHSHRVSELSAELALKMGLPPDEVERVRIGGLLHDIGKIGVPDDILRKQGRLTPEEFEVVKTHTTIGRRILERVQGLDPYISVVELHHENWDGSGYPHGYKGLEVPVAARIVHVVDSYDAITTDRPYRRGMTHEEAVAILTSFAGTQFDAAIVDALLAARPAEVTAVLAR